MKRQKAPVPYDLVVRHRDVLDDFARLRDSLDEAMRLLDSGRSLDEAMRLLESKCSLAKEEPAIKSAAALVSRLRDSKCCLTMDERQLVADFVEGKLTNRTTRESQRKFILWMRIAREVAYREICCRQHHKAALGDACDIFHVEQRTVYEALAFAEQCGGWNEFLKIALRLREIVEKLLATIPDDDVPAREALAKALQILYGEAQKILTGESRKADMRQ